MPIYLNFMPFRINLKVSKVEPLALRVDKARDTFEIKGIQDTQRIAKDCTVRVLGQPGIQRIPKD